MELKSYWAIYKIDMMGKTLCVTNTSQKLQLHSKATNSDEVLIHCKFNAR